MSLAVFVGTVGLWLAALPAGTELQYSGKLERGEDAANAEKTFTLTVTVTDPDQACFLVDERGGGGWSWPQRFGKLELSTPRPDAIRLLYLFDGNPAPIPVRSAFFEYADRLEPETEWSGAGGQYSCLQTRMTNGRELAIVEVSLDRGRRQHLEIDTATGLIVALRERLFLGRGEAFHLSMQLDQQRELPAAELQATRSLAAGLLEIQARLTPPDSRFRSQLNAEELAATSTAISNLGPASESLWGRFVTSIQRDLGVQARRLEGVQGLAAKYIGREADTSGDWKRVDGEPLANIDRQGHTTVLHFWDYDGEKLTEPYGQVGYLDFLHNRRRRLGAQIIGVAVDSRFSDPAQAKSAARSIRKFQDFMNVSFPVAADDGTLLSRFGDPRAIGAELPLWVVIGHDGKITHYKVGYYDLQPDEGLRELDASVVEALKREKQAERDQ